MSQILLSSYPFVFPNAYSLDFDGSNEHVTLPGNPVDANAGFTIEAWVKLDATTSDSDCVFSQDENDNNYWTVVCRADGLAFQYGPNTPGGVVISSGVVVTPGQWMHIAVSREVNTWPFHINGIQVAAPSNTPSAALTVIGSTSFARRVRSPTVYFSGLIDEIRCWDTPRTTEEIAANMSRNLIALDEPRLTGYWRFEEGTGTTADDETTNNQGALVNTPTWSTDKPY